MPRRYRDEDDDRPRRRHRDHDEDRPRSRKPARGKKRGPNVALIVGGAVGGVVLLAGVVLLVVVLADDKGGDGPTAADPFAGMLAHWSFDDVAETRVPDGSKRGNDGVFNGGGFVAGKKGRAFFLEGRPDTYVDVSKGKDLNFADGAEFTIAAWFQAREKYAGTILAFRHSQYPTQLDLYVRDSRVICIVGDDTDVDGKHAHKWVDEPSAANGEWHHAAFTRKGKFVELFYDGYSLGKTAHERSGGPITTDLRAIGCNLRFVQDNVQDFGRAGFRGTIDEVYVFSRALSEPEIKALMKR